MMDAANDGCNGQKGQEQRLAFPHLFRLHASSSSFSRPACVVEGGVSASISAVDPALGNQNSCELN
jgi:hypothetical protein